MQAVYDDDGFQLSEYFFDQRRGTSTYNPFKGLIRVPEGLNEFENEPLFSSGIDSLPEVLPVSQSTQSGGVALLYYHKTGYAFSLGLLNKLAGTIQNKNLYNLHGQKYKNGHRSQNFFSDAIKIEGEGWLRVNQPSATMPFPEGARVIHFYRNPVSRLLSAYRYHSQKTTAEPWEGGIATCQWCTEEENAMIFSSCEHNCNYFDLLQQLNETQGIKIEALDSRQTIEQSIFNMWRWVNNGDVLHLSMEHLATDFDATMSCILQFLNMTVTENQLAKLQKLDVKRNPNKHVTRGNFDNSKLKTYLESHKHWGPQFTAIQSVENQIWLRQKNLYGCPVPNKDI